LCSSGRSGKSCGKSWMISFAFFRGFVRGSMRQHFGSDVL